MKKILGIISLFLGIELIACLVAGFVMKIPQAVPSSAVFLYKLCTAFEYFFKYLPAIILTGFTASCSVQFGHNSEGSENRFSSAMFKRFKTVMICALMCTALLSLSEEVFTLAIRQKKNQIINRPKIISEYIKVGNNLYDEGLYERAQKYALAALRLDPASEPAMDLKGKTDIELNKVETESLKFDLENAEPLVEEDNTLNIDSDAISTVHDFVLKSKEAFENQNWFDAHYYAECGKKIITSKDPEYEELIRISTDAWNNLESEYETAKDKKQLQFEEKYNGYSALMNKDDLQAYYIFRALSEDPEMKHDNDVNFYYEIARERIEQKYFFIDETFELKSFESANDVYFIYNHLGGTKDIVYFKGMTEVGKTGQAIQYLRDFSIVSFDKEGNWIKTMHCPYAKVMSVSVKSINSITKNLLEISDDTDCVPYILLKSIGRDDSSQVYVPTFTYADESETHVENDYLLFPLDFDEFLMLENSTENPQDAYLGSLIKFVSRAEKYGYSETVFGNIVLNRILYPIMLLVIFIFLAAFAWNNRIGDTQYFKFSWIFGFPIIICILFIFYQLVLFQFKMLNYVIYSITGSMWSILLGFAVHIVFLIAVSLYFLCRKASD